MLGRTVLHLLRKTGALRSDIQLQPHQERVVEKTRELPEDAGLLVYHGLGSGKTIASIAAAEAKGGTANAVVPASLRENFKKELLKATGDAGSMPVQSYQQAVKNNPGGDVTIFDEAHRMGQPDTAQSGLASTTPGNKLLLTGSPIRNRPNELQPLLQAMSPDRDVPANAEAFDRRFVEPAHQNGWLKRLFGAERVQPAGIKDEAGLAELVRGRVDYHASQGEFPTTKSRDIEVEMSDDQTDLYHGLNRRNPGLMWKLRNDLPPSKAESTQLNAFLAAVRQVSNTPSTFWSEASDAVEESPKLKRMYAELMKRKSDPNHRALVYSNYLDSGVKPLADRLNRDGQPSAVFSGELGDQQRKAMIEQYNSGKLRNLLISGAGSEGLDLKGTSLVQLMEPHWNEARSDQVVGRAVRHQSHSHLPADKRQVEIQRFFARPKPTLWQRLGMGDEDPGADRHLEALARKKQELNEQFLAVLQREGARP